VPDVAQITCRYCGMIVEAYRSNQFRCGSADCLREYNREAMAKLREERVARRESRSCRECGAPFTDIRGNKQFCTPECGRANLLKRRRDREYQPPIKNCDFCGGQIPYKSGKKRYCSAECQKAGIAKEARWRIKGLPPGLVVSTACELCGAAERNLVIDHDHSCCPGGNACGKCFRGMLCRPCNVALGMFREDTGLIRRAADYIEKAKERYALAKAP
jgi:hypothetical protein